MSGLGAGKCPTVGTLSGGADDLLDLAARIDAEHGEVAAALQSALGHAISAGELLIEAKRQIKHGGWLPWLKANCSVPARTASHYIRLAKRRADLCDGIGNVLPISVTKALRLLLHYDAADPDGSGYSEWGDYVRYDGWGRLAWGAPFVQALRAVTRITQLHPPAPRYVVKAARAGKTPGLSAPALREAIALLTRYAIALEADAGRRLFSPSLPPGHDGTCHAMSRDVPHPHPVEPHPRTLPLRVRPHPPKMRPRSRAQPF